MAKPTSSSPRRTKSRPSRDAASEPNRRAPRPTVAGLGDDVGAAELGRRVAESLRALRRGRGLSLDQLAEASGVSRAALSQIESARTNPTLTILWKVAAGLDVPFQALLGPTDGRRARALRAGDNAPLRSADGRMESRLVSPAGSNPRVEIYELRFLPKGVLRSESHGPSSTETVLVLTGALRIVTGDEPHDLRAGDSLYFPADERHAYENLSSHESRCLDIIVYGRDEPR